MPADIDKSGGNFHLIGWQQFIKSRLHISSVKSDEEDLFEYLLNWFAAQPNQFTFHQVQGLCMLTGSANLGQVDGILYLYTQREKQPDLNDSVRSQQQLSFVPGFPNIFIIGEKSKPWTSCMPKKEACLIMAEDRDSSQNRAMGEMISRAEKWELLVAN